MTISTMIFFQKMIITIFEVYSMVFYHFITLGEERFIAHRFGKEYLDYKSRIRRYL
jgi:protein-S-isoprenylcysteine O-methyltransferase Ste14